MKTLNYFLKGFWLLIKVLFVPLVFMVGCTKQDITPVSVNENLSAMNQKSLVVHEGTIPLQGFTRFAFYATKESRFITDGYTNNFLVCTAELIFGENQNFVLHTREFLPYEVAPTNPLTLYREITFNGKMTPSGQLKFTWPESWWELGTIRGDVLAQIKEHTGMDISGQGINNNTTNYMGSFDGDKLFADMHIVGLQEVPGTMPFFAVIVDGPVLINMMIDLEVSD